MKKAGVSHRDLSLENLLVEDGNVLVIDMGMCLRIPTIDIDGARRRTLILPQGVCGKWHYMSPGRTNPTTSPFCTFFELALTANFL